MDLSNIVFIESKKSGQSGKKKNKKGEQWTVVPPKQNEPWSKKKFGKVYHYCPHCKYWALHHPGKGKNCKGVNPVVNLTKSFGGKGSFQSANWFVGKAGSNGFVGSVGDSAMRTPDNQPFDATKPENTAGFASSSSPFAVEKFVSNGNFGGPALRQTPQMSPFGHKQPVNPSLLANNHTPTFPSYRAHAQTGSLLGLQESKEEKLGPPPSVSSYQGLWALQTKVEPIGVPRKAGQSPAAYQCGSSLRSPVPVTLHSFGHQNMGLPSTAPMVNHAPPETSNSTHFPVPMEVDTTYSETQITRPQLFSSPPQFVTPPLVAPALVVPAWGSSESFSFQMTALEAKRQEMERLLTR